MCHNRRNRLPLGGIMDSKCSKLFENSWAKWWQSMTGLNIRDESHLHESILFGFPEEAMMPLLLITVYYMQNITYI